MNTSTEITQQPRCGTGSLCIKGDLLTFRLMVPSKWKGRAWLRTNIGHGITLKKEIVRQVEHDENPMGRDWYDIPMQRLNKDIFEVTVGLFEVGHFEAKCYFLAQAKNEPLWPEGLNSAVNVEPADTCCANIIYNAFVRQFGPTKSGLKDTHNLDKECLTLDQKGYTVIPPSGTFRNLISELDFIIEELGSRIIQLLPIHPTPTTYARMGRFGSPYASLSFTAVDPALAEFDPRATPLEQFIELVDAIHARKAKIFLDIAINHTGWAASLHESHPKWLAREEGGEIKVPGAWGVKWADLTRLDYSHTDLWVYMANIFLTWCQRGVDGFRCDAGYMIPAPAWKYIIAKVRQQFPDTVFLLEGLGGKISTTRHLLNDTNFNWAYSELFQNYDRDQIESYLPFAIDIAMQEGLTIHFAETHDNNRLAATSKTYAQMRTALCALLSHQGGFGFANGVEWLATEKIDVHNSPALNWGAPDNQVDWIKRLNTLLRVHPAFAHPTRIRWVQAGSGNFLAVARYHLPTDKRLLILVNLNSDQSITATWNNQPAQLELTAPIDLMTFETISVKTNKNVWSCELNPGQVRCLSSDDGDIQLIKTAESNPKTLPAQIRLQQLKAKVLESFSRCANSLAMDKSKIDGWVELLDQDPVRFCHAITPFSKEPGVIHWRWSQDCRRHVMVPPRYFLMVVAPHPFRAMIFDRKEALAVEQSITDQKGNHFALFLPQPTPPKHKGCQLKLAIFKNEKTIHATAELLYLSPQEANRVKCFFSRADTHQDPLLMLGTNGRGAMLRVHADWRRLNSRYDALLAANLNPNYPEDRHILLTRIRAWSVFQDFSTEIGPDCLDGFDCEHDSKGYWYYHIPTGQGEHIYLTIGIAMVPGQNMIVLEVKRHFSQSKKGGLPDDKPIRLILRPDIEDRNFHETTKAYLGPEKTFPASITSLAKGFWFQPAQDRRLLLKINQGKFYVEPQWQYMVYRPLEDQRGLDPHSDLFSPGYFACPLIGNQSVVLKAWAGSGKQALPKAPTIITKRTKKPYYQEQRFIDLETALKQALEHYVVQRGEYRTVIAGYPWFLDWGRDTLIVLRGLIAAGRWNTARAILNQFARFEDHGTLPNMIRGNDVGNRDTSDAPLWFFTAVSDLIRSEGDLSFLETDFDGRTLRQVLIDLAQSIIIGTPNGVKMDPETGLVYSPPHFTWMDTNFPAGTPREGYPIEIQALWYAALSFLERIDNSSTSKSAWQNLAQRVKESIMALFFLKQEGYLSDCLHASKSVSAKQAVADNALRPNQLFALTLAAVSEKIIAQSVLAACEELLVPGAIRTLSNRQVQPPLEIIYNGKLLNDPEHPYQGRYQADEDTSRKPAYHNGTAWTWVFPSYCEAWVMCYGDSAVETAKAWLTSSTHLINTGCGRQLPEIVDGDYPHKQRGCDAQAWGISEFLRVWLKLKNSDDPLVSDP
jgi:starch synthase (maltosyl-transferring)